jgi:hypothetical protein
VLRSSGNCCTKTEVDISLGADRDASLAGFDWPLELELPELKACGVAKFGAC